MGDSNNRFLERMNKAIEIGFPVTPFAMRYTSFAPRLFNYCLSLGMQPGNIMPSRAFCSDENQGYPIILLAKHFGTFPFDHGRVGGIVAIDRHRPHSDHGKDLVIIQASHVGYEPDNRQFGIYRRLQTVGHEYSTNCGAICELLGWYQNEYGYACRHILLSMADGKHIITIDNQLLKKDLEQGLFLNMDKLLHDHNVLRAYSTSKSFIASKDLVERIGEAWPQTPTELGNRLEADQFYFVNDMEGVFEASGFLNRNLINAMPGILTSMNPALAAAQINTQVEFDRAYRTLVKEDAYHGKKLVFISGINIDISPTVEMQFPLTKFVPWAAYIRDDNGTETVLEQQELFDQLKKQSIENPYKIDLTSAIHEMEAQKEIKLKVK